jgi:hypothetical protein
VDPDGLNIVRVTHAFHSSRVQGDLEQIASHLPRDAGFTEAFAEALAGGRTRPS